MHLQGLDLNLLIALDALLTETNVTRAAERIHISQPGMSAALQKLRWHFKDPLLERIGRRLELTPRARELVEPVRDILHRVRGLSAPDCEFDPATAQRVFRVACSTYCSEMFALPLAARLGKTAPGIAIQFDDLLCDTVARLIDGSVDCTITLLQRLTLDPAHAGAEKSLNSQGLFSDRLVIAAAAGNVALASLTTYDEFCELPYVETRFGNQFLSLSEDIFQRQGRQPATRMRLPSFQQTLQLIAETDMVGMAPLRLVERYADRLGLQWVECPIEIPVLDEQIFWHPRNDQDAGHRWFRELLTEVVESVMGSPRAGSVVDVDFATRKIGETGRRTA